MSFKWAEMRGRVHFTFKSSAEWQSEGLVEANFIDIYERFYLNFIPFVSNAMGSEGLKIVFSFAEWIVEKFLSDKIL